MSATADDSHMVPPGYMQTEVGVIPEDWKVFKLGDIVDYTKGFAFKSSEYQSYGVRIIRVSDTSYDSILETDPVHISSAKASVYRKWGLKENDLIISTVGSKPPMYDSLVGKVIQIPGSHEGALLNQNAVIIRDKKRRSYIQRIMLNHFRTQRYLTFIESIFRGNANQASITLEELFQFTLPIPNNTQEQRTIATTLSDADALITSLDTLIAKKRAIKQGAMQQLLTGKTRLPGFEGKWEHYSLADIGKFFKGKGIKKDEVSDEGVGCIRYGELYTRYHNYILKPVSRIPLTVAATALPIQMGDLLFAGSGETAEEIGRCAAYLGKEEAYAGGDIVVLRPSGHNPFFLGHLMNHETVARQKARLGQGDAVVHISSRNLGLVEVRLPHYNEQTAIATVLSNMDDEISNLEQRRDKTKAIKQGMMQELLTGKTRLIKPEAST